MAQVTDGADCGWSGLRMGQVMNGAGSGCGGLRMRQVTVTNEGCGNDIPNSQEGMGMRMTRMSRMTRITRMPHG